MVIDSAIRDHQAWLGYLQPDGLVVSPAALVDSQVYLDNNTIPLQLDFLNFVPKRDQYKVDIGIGSISNLYGMFKDFLGWPDECLNVYNTDTVIPEKLMSPLPEYGEILTPSFAFFDTRIKNEECKWVLLGKVLPEGQSLDEVPGSQERTWGVSEARRFERLLRETGVYIGLITNLSQIRLIYAPRGENTGSITFPVDAMTEVSGRPILSAFHMLLSRTRLLSAASEVRLPALLKRSRDYQGRVSTELSRQVLNALYELQRGFQSANEYSHSELLKQVLAENPNDVYAGLLTVLMRLVFLLYAEDRGLMPASALYGANYSVHGLFEKLRTDNEHFPDTMDHRYGAWAQLVALFGAIFKGCNHREMKMPARKGYLFDPLRYPFLIGNGGHVPLVSDGVVYRALQGLLILNGERLSYRTLDVEQIGSVYETMMGFRLEVTKAQSIALKPAKKRGAPAVIDLEECLKQKAGDRIKWIAEISDQKVSGSAADMIKSATSIDDLLVALEKRIARNATPHPVPAGCMVLQPSDERRRSGSHYTPRSLTEPIVRTTLKPILERLGEKPTPKQILGLKIADIAVGSGAFLVETCRQLGDELVKAWHNHNEKPVIPPDEDDLLFARRKVAQQCLYGVDRNPMAVDLAKLSLWLATLAKDHPFTFLDHSIRSGDSLVGLSKKQIAEFHWIPGQNRVWGQDEIDRKIEQASKYRRELLEADEDFVSPELKTQKLKLADEALNFVRQMGDCVIAAFFAGKNDKERQSKRDVLLDQIVEFYKSWDADMSPNNIVKKLKTGQFPVTPFHWEIEFPEVFGRENPGFDGIVGNPPFAGKNTLLNGNIEGYLDWLKIIHEESHGNADLVAHFFRRAFVVLRNSGTFGLIATNTISQGDTRQTGLRWICTHSGTIYNARKRFKWPGEAAVVVSVINVFKGAFANDRFLNETKVSNITAYLFHNGSNESPSHLYKNKSKSFQGSILLGMGFTFDDTDTSGKTSSIELMNDLIKIDTRNVEMIRPYIGGEEILDSPTQKCYRYAIDFFDRSLEEASKWPDLLKIVREKVKPDRDGQKRDANRERWWQYAEKRPGLYKTINNLIRVLALSRVGQHCAISFLPSDLIYADSVVVFTFESYKYFAALQSRPHEIWTRFFSSSMKDDLRYTPSDCFETFAFPLNLETNEALEKIGREYYEFRAALMVRNNEGLTKTYNRFHDRDHDGTGIENRTSTEVMGDIDKLRTLHSTMDRAVLDAYGWTDINPTCEFILDYEDDEDDTESSRKRKKPWRYKWPEEIHDEVLARLLALNAKRAEEELLAGKDEKKAVVKVSKKKNIAKVPSQTELNL